MRALVTGATGFIGRQLLRQLAAPVVLTRNPTRAQQTLARSSVGLHAGADPSGDPPSGSVGSQGHQAQPPPARTDLGLQAWAWDPEHASPPPAAFEGVDVVFHLAGEPVGEGRWTAAKKARVRDSRVIGTRHLVDTLVRLEHQPRVLVAVSAVGYYGDRGEELLDETAAPGGDFLAEVCAAWERESQRAREAGIRVVQPRLGIVLGRDGGALPRMLTPFKLGLGSPLGSGRQWVPWIHIADVVGLLLFVADQSPLAGPVNAVAPQPVRNRDLTRVLARTLHRPALLPAVPAWALRMMLGEFAQGVLGSQRLQPRAALAAGFQFRFPELDSALTDLLVPLAEQARTTSV